jgi:hypothetical protein
MKFHNVKISYLHTYVASCFILVSYLNIILMSLQMTSSKSFSVLVGTGDTRNCAYADRYEKSTGSALSGQDFKRNNGGLVSVIFARFVLWGHKSFS